MALPSTSSIDSLGIGAASTSTIYVGSNSGNVYVTTDNGATWNTRTPSGGNSFNNFAVDPTNSSIAYVVSASFTGGTRIWRTTNAGATWMSIQGNLPNLPAYDVVLDPGATASPTDDVLYLADDRGVYRSTDFTSASPTWARFGLGLPNVVVRDLELAPTLGILAAGTYGRGVWEIFTSPAGTSTRSISGQQFNDQNNNGTHDAGEPSLPGWTVYLDGNNNSQFDPVLSGPTSFAASSLPAAIPDLSSTTSSITTSGLPGVVTNITVSLDISHPFDSDLVVDLISPTGRIVNLFTGVGGSGDNFSGTILDDAAATAISSGVAPFIGSFRPLQPLSTLIGGTPNGTWTLRINDLRPVNSGVLNAWSIRMTTGEVSQTTDASGNYVFANLDAGTYQVREVNQQSRMRTLPVPPADNYSVTVTNTSPAVVGRDFGVVAVPPTVANVQVDNGASQRSMVRSLTVVFSDLIQYVGDPTAAFTLSKQAGGTVSLSVNTVTVGSHSEAILNFLSDATFGSLDDGRYTLTVNASQVQSLSGANLAADSVTDFHRMFGDVNGDQIINGLDFGFFKNAFGTQVGDPNYLDYLDYNGDGVINGFDFGQFRTRFGTSLP